mgnify:CR=1 FL=1
MIDVVVKIAGSIFCAGAGILMFSIGIIILTTLCVECCSRVKEWFND